MIGNDGYITLDAIRWLTNLGIGYLHLDRDGTILAATENRSGDARLRRLQADAASSPVGVEIARYLLGTKVDGQARNLDLIPDNERGRDAIYHWQQQIRDASTLDELLEAEREAAAAHWACWAGTRLQIRTPRPGSDPQPLETGWPTSQPAHEQPARRHHTVNAILNYLYAILESEPRSHVSPSVSSIPDLGSGPPTTAPATRSHLPQGSRATKRDRYVLKLIGSRTFTRKDIGETSRGICRLLHPSPASSHKPRASGETRLHRTPNTSSNSSPPHQGRGSTDYPRPSPARAEAAAKTNDDDDQSQSQPHPSSRRRRASTATAAFQTANVSTATHASRCLSPNGAPTPS